MPLRDNKGEVLNRSSAEAGNLKVYISSLRNSLAGDFGIMVAATTVASAINYLFNIVMNRLLGKAAFGDLYSMLSALLIITMGALSVQTVITKYIAQFEAEGEQDKVHILVKKFSKIFLVTGSAAIVLSVALAWPVASVMKLESPLYVIILGTTVGIALYLCLPFGILQGEQRFAGLGIANIGNAVFRMFLGVGLVLAGFGVFGALGATPIAGGAVAAIVMYMFRDKLRPPEDTHVEFDILPALKYLAPVAVSIFLVYILTQVDVILVKILFSRTAAGTYSYAALAGKAVLFLPEGISLVMFPRVSELKARGQPTRRVLAYSLLAVTLMVSAVAGFYALFPDFTAYLFAGARGKDVVGYMGMFGLVMAIFSVVKMLTFYHLALEKKAFIFWLAAACILEIAGIYMFHGSLLQVLYVLLVVGAGLLAVNLLTAFWKT
ncbi:MAG: oligosaccharide flippase family protein [Actinobacteria bacterium]|nr:oligosaccharide flippase family protein [Actinomycetota bacterium]